MMGSPRNSMNCLEGAVLEAAPLLPALDAPAIRVPRPAAGIMTITRIGRGSIAKSCENSGMTVKQQIDKPGTAAILRPAMLNHIKDIAQIVSYLVGAFAAFAAALNYRKSSRVERAKWLASLYDKFYERDLLKRIREALDCSAHEATSVDELVQNEGSEFTDYLNFFEFVAYLTEAGQLSKRDVDAM